MAWPTDAPKNPYGSEPIPIRACTFEAPRVGNQLYAEAFTNEDIPGLSMVRIVNKGDLVPEVRQLQSNLHQPRWGAMRRCSGSRSAG